MFIASTGRCCHWYKRHNVLETSSTILLVIPFRFHHYDCLVVPVGALSDHSLFLWEKVSLLIEYEPLKTPLFSTWQSAGSTDGQEDPSMPDGSDSALERLHLHEYISLRTVLDLSTSNILFSTGW